MTQSCLSLLSAGIWVIFTVNRKKTGSGDFTSSHISPLLQGTECRAVVLLSAAAWLNMGMPVPGIYSWVEVEKSCIIKFQRCFPDELRLDLSREHPAVLISASRTKLCWPNCSLGKELFKDLPEL